jgi:hypothetical protein
MGTCV